MNHTLRRKHPFRSTSRYLAKVLLVAAVAAPGAAHADWESTLKTKFPIVETFDNLADWSPAKGGGNYYNQSVMPKKPDGSKGIWTYYSSWSTGGTSPWIANFGTGNSVTGKSAIIDIGGAAGPSRLGTYFGNGTPNSGYSDIFIFYRAKYPKNEWPTAIDSTSKLGSYVDGQPLTYWMSWKSNTLNMGCTGVNANTECSGAEPYSNYHIVPHIKPYGSSTRRLYYRIEPTGASTDSSKGLWTSGYDVPREKWGGVEFHYRNYQEGSQLKTAMDVWLYDEDGTQHQVLAHGIFDYSGLHPATDKWNFFFLGGNNSGAYTWGPTMQSKYYVDDFIISGTRVGPTYFTLWNANKSSLGTPNPPTNLRAAP